MICNTLQVGGSRNGGYRFDPRLVTIGWSLNPIPMPKMKFLLATATALTALASLPAAASVVSMQTRLSNAAAAPAGTMAQMGDYYRNLVEGLVTVAPTNGYCDAMPAAYLSLENSSVCAGSNNNIAVKFEVDFGISVAQAGTMSIQIGPDFGKGGAVFLDGTLLAATVDDLWWSGNYGATNEIFSFQNIGVAAGNHTLTVYGLEACCDGINSARYQLAGDAAWTTFSVRDSLQAVPEPLTAALVLAGLLAMPHARRTRSC